MQAEFWSAQRVFLTGHTGFKGSWMALWLERLGARVFGFALPPEQTPNLYAHLQPFTRLTSTIGDIRHGAKLARAVAKANPTIAIHMAAQPLVRRSYAEPVETFAANTLGTANVLQALRGAPELRATLVITTDKVYRNFDSGQAFAEDDPLGGHDPYAASKAAAELVVRSYGESFFEPAHRPVATARAGNVLGGGDWSEDRLIPDIWRAKHRGTPAVLRYPQSVRPWQHVLDPLAGYLVFLQRLVADPKRTPRALNFGPTDQAAAMTVEQIADFVAAGLGTSWVADNRPKLPEMKFLALDATKAVHALGWRPRLDLRQTLEWTLEWYRRFDAGEDPRALTTEQIERYETLRPSLANENAKPDSQSAAGRDDRACIGHQSSGRQ
jgi:CDP-glucose 4,6-dehydratase